MLTLGRAESCDLRLADLTVSRVHAQLKRVEGQWRIRENGVPLDTRGEAARTPDTRSLYPKEDKLLRRYMRDVGVSNIPPTLDAYVAAVLVPTLERERRAGAVAVKFEAAYLRPLDFGDTDLAAALEM